MNLGHLLRTAMEGRPCLFGALVTVVVFGSAVSSQVVLRRTSEEALRDSVRSNLTRLAEAAATVVDRDLHEKMKSPNQEASAEYHRAIAPLRKLQASNKDIAFVYTCIEQGGKVYFVLDPTDAGDSDGDGVDDKSHVMQPYEEATPELKQVFRTGVAMAEKEPYTDRWGTFISGYAPLRDEHGRMYGLIGIDLSAKRYMERLGALNGAFVRGVLAAALIALGVGIAGALYRRTADLRNAILRKKDEEHKFEIAESLRRLEAACRTADISRARFSQLFQGLPLPCITFDREKHVFEWNSKAEKVFGITAHAMQAPLSALIGSRLCSTDFDMALTRLLEGESFTDLEVEDGTRCFLFSGHPLRDFDGGVTGGILAAVDLTRQKSAEEQARAHLDEIRSAHALLNRANSDLQLANEKLEQLASTDPLTGLANKRVLEERLLEFIELAKRGRPFSVVMLDIDYFKQFNDRFGHVVGDQVLRDMGAVLRTPLRSHDLLARYGGEEFCVLLRDAGVAAAAIICERMRASAEEHDFGFGDVTISLGVSEWSPEMLNPLDVILAADRALYEAKAAGRNRVAAAQNRASEAA